ncbi:primosomal protein N' [Lactobacillus corticis]|uniref:Replication restart protein PriA n=1 Tax=Lactobacillus corticis TaxID=2201249 RepID=A0A916QH49_9LACO|nr:primosomal protein N' [Lactobacillus corticis]GFZ27260.1 primosomal protein N' [Lactobacillus corticis]
MIAQVIVDIAASQTDRVFEYHIPDDLSGVAIGSRVVVPFGKRKLQGFVVGISKTTDYDGKLRDLLLVTDEQPPLTKELVELSAFLAKAIFAFRISILQTMLPRVMRANYRKILIPLTPEAKKLPYFQQTAHEVDKITDPEELKFVQKLLKDNQAKIEYLVENQAKEKHELIYLPALANGQYQELYEQTRKTATKQRALLMDLVTARNSYPKSGSAMHDQGFSSALLKAAEEKGWIKCKEVEVYRDPLADVASKKPAELKLNPEQAKALAKIGQAISDQQAHPFLLEGVTGSGKTEVYLRAISQALSAGRNALMLVPEISLTPQMVRQVRERFGQEVAVLHSALSDGERYDEWRRIRRGEARVVVGARSAVFAPLENIGLIIIDEEHEASYKQEDNPRYHARDVALWRAKFHHCPLVLGSATPSLASRARAQKGLYTLLRLTERANQHPLPEVKIIDLKQAAFAGGQYDLSTELASAIQERLARHEQVILMLNRRGFANFMLCRDCGFVLQCPNCDLSLTMHKAAGEMRCHYCGHHEPIPKRCPNCHSSQIRFMGTGTQKVEQELTELFPGVRIIRMDVDTTRRKGSYKRKLDAFGRKEADILLGTQMIAKGLDFPNVTLVGVINADTGLWVPDYNASERTFQLLTQVAGRAGRAEKKGQVLIQTYNPEHYAIRLAQTQDYEQFYRYEMRMRHAGDYPPYYYTVLISVAAKNETNAAREAFKIRRQLNQQLHPETIVLGPTPSAISRLKNQYYYQILVKYKKEPKLNDLLHQIQDAGQKVKKYGLTINIDNEPERIM